MKECSENKDGFLNSKGSKKDLYRNSIDNLKKLKLSNSPIETSPYSEKHLRSDEKLPTPTAKTNRKHP